MPRVLLTGSSGQVGRACIEVLEAAGWTIATYDLAEGHDLRDAAAVLDAAGGCAAVVHAGALAHDTAGTPDEIVSTNVLGTWNVLCAAEAHGLERVIYFSSAQVFGCAEGESTPAYLPIDDHHPLRAARPYGMSKRLSEEMCEMWTARTGITTIVLRPVMMLDDDSLTEVTKDQAEFEAFVHVEDVAQAVCRALTVDLADHVRMTLCGPGAFDTSKASATLGWRPHHSWADVTTMKRLKRYRR